MIAAYGVDKKTGEIYLKILSKVEHEYINVVTGKGLRLFWPDDSHGVKINFGYD